MIKTLADLRESPTPAWIWHGILTPGGLTLLSAFPKVGKTTFLAYMLRAMWTEDSYMELAIRPAPTLIISEEADSLIALRCNELGFNEMWPLGWLTPEPGRTWEHIVGYMTLYAKLYHHPLIILDTLSRHWGIEDENDNAKVEQRLSPLIALARTTGASLLLAHHTRKSGGFGGTASRGGSALVGAVDIILELNRVERGDRTNRRKLESFSRYAETPGCDEPMIIQLSEEGYIYKGAAPSAASASSDGVLRWLTSNPGWWSVKSIASVTGFSARAVQNTLDDLVFEDEVTRRGTGTRGHPFTYTSTEVE